MAAFLGFGIGFFLHNRSDKIFPWFPRLACLLIFIISWANSLGITHVIFVDPRQYFLLGTGFGDHAAQSVPSLFQTFKAIIVIVLVFFLTMATFATLTTKVGELLNQEKPLTGYSINVMGSLLGIAGFSLVSYLEWPPIVWLILVFLPLLYFYVNYVKLTAIYFIAAIICTFVAGNVDPAIWSPYYRISVKNCPLPYDPYQKGITVNYDGFQSINYLSQQHIGKFPESVQRQYAFHYNIPYCLSKKEIKSVLILGGGAGNDAAAAIRNGANRVDVVEIDPAIARIGRKLHPEKPYSSDKVHLYIDDARSFLQKTNRKYDLVVFATLDSHTVFSSLSSLRLDNFVFTRESLLSAKNKLNRGGGIAINFFISKRWLFYRHFNNLKEVIETEPLIYADEHEYQEATFLAGDIFDKSKSPGITSYVPLEAPSDSPIVEPTTDDWPFLFLEKRGVPFHYLLPLFIIFMLSFIPLQISRIRVQDINWHLFFLGAAFLLIETKAVTTLALIFGSTWMVNSIVFSAVLIMILLANLLTARLSFLSFPSLYIGLFATLLFNYLFSFDTLNQFEWNIQLLSGGFIIGLPLFFAALIFAKAFAVVESPSLSLASNLFGALVGGLLEYLDMWTGLRGLNLVALILYGLSFIFLYVKNKRSFSIVIEKKL
jgi:spermidine synthase